MIYIYTQQYHIAYVYVCVYRVKLLLFKRPKSQMTFHAVIPLPSFKSLEAIDVGTERRWHPEIQSVIVTQSGD